MSRGLVLLFAFLLLGCSSPLVPPAHSPYPARSRQSDTVVIEHLRQNWILLGRKNITEDERARALHEYNRNLLLLVRRLRHDAADSSLLKYEEFDLQPQADIGVERFRELYDDIIPAADVELKSLQEHYTLPGIGVPMVGIIPESKLRHEGTEQYCIGTTGTVRALTAVMTFPPNSKPLLRLVVLRHKRTLPVGGWNYPLAADWSAPLEVYWDLTRVRDNRFVGLLRPQQLRNSTGLFAMEPYNPDKIPVILTHGLASSSGTFDNLVNRLLSSPEIRRNYQFWYFNYPTGVAWTVSARVFRESLKKLRAQVDPQHRNPNWKHLVLVGHSMGGLITHYSQCTEPWNLLRAANISAEQKQRYLHRKYLDAPFPESSLELLREDYFFRPVEAGMVIYMATPHRGAPVARYRIVTFLSKLVTLPKVLLAEAYNIATLQQDMFILNPRNAYQWFTSVGQLKPDSYSIRGLQGLSVRQTPTHSIIGDNGGGDCPRCSDGVVPYWSSHIPWGTQTIVPADHSVQDAPESANDLIRIFSEYAARNPAVKASVRHKRRALPRCTGQVSHPSFGE